MAAEEESMFPTARELNIYREVERFFGVCHAHKIADCVTCGDKNMEKCEHCGLIDGHANRCFVDVLMSRVLVYDKLLAQARTLIDPPSEHAKSVAMWNLKDAVAEFDRIERRESRKV